MSANAFPNVAPSGMVLPPASPVDGELIDRPTWDVRVPAPAGSWREGTEVQPKPLAYYLDCLERGGRHLFDVLEAGYGVQHDDDDHGPYAETIHHRTRMTCVNCGLVLSMRGEYVMERHERLEHVAPLVVGALCAQQVSARSFGSTWAVYELVDPEARLCWISWARTRRGREYYAARLGDDVLEAPTVAGVLRKIAKARA
jgi:hypothetical protein